MNQTERRCESLKLAVATMHPQAKQEALIARADSFYEWMSKDAPEKVDKPRRGRPPKILQEETTPEPNLTR